MSCLLQQSINSLAIRVQTKTTYLIAKYCANCWFKLYVFPIYRLYLFLMWIWASRTQHFRCWRRWNHISPPFICHFWRPHCSWFVCSGCALWRNWLSKRPANFPWRSKMLSRLACISCAKRCSPPSPKGMHYLSDGTAPPTYTLRTRSTIACGCWTQ